MSEVRNTLTKEEVELRLAEEKQYLEETNAKLQKAARSSVEYYLRKRCEIKGRIAILSWILTGKCYAVIHHGPGHQSTTHCQIPGMHECHQARYGSYQQEGYWRGPEAFSGFFDEPPSHEEE